MKLFAENEKKSCAKVNAHFQHQFIKRLSKNEKAGEERKHTCSHQRRNLSFECTC